MEREIETNENVTERVQRIMIELKDIMLELEETHLSVSGYLGETDILQTLEVTLEREEME